jgi:hypothetical protein
MPVRFDADHEHYGTPLTELAVTGVLSFAEVAQELWILGFRFRYQALEGRRHGLGGI